MRVSMAEYPMATYRAENDAHFGIVYCVRDCWRSGTGHVIFSIVGIPEVLRPNGSKCGWVTANFRKVEEIQLCVKAEEHAKKPQRHQEPIAIP